MFEKSQKQVEFWRELCKLREQTTLLCFMEDFECVVCFGIPSSTLPIYSCGRCGNLVCAACTCRLISPTGGTLCPRCPSCRQCLSFTPFVRNRVAEKAVQRFEAMRK